MRKEPSTPLENRRNSLTMGLQDRTEKRCMHSRRSGCVVAHANLEMVFRLLGRVLSLLDVSAPTQRAVHVKERPHSPKNSTIQGWFQVPEYLTYPLRYSIAFGTHLQDNKVVLVHHCVRALEHTSPVYLGFLCKLVRGIAGRDLLVTQLPSSVVPNLSLHKHHLQTSTKDTRTTSPSM